MENALVMPGESSLANEFFELTPTALIIDKQITREQWEELGVFVGQAVKAGQWWAGDWYNHQKRGERNPEKVKKITGLEYETIQKYGWIARRFQTRKRFQVLTHFHHQIAAPLPEPDRYEALEWAASFEPVKTTRELKDYIREARLLEAPDLPHGVYNVLYVDPPWRYEHSKTDSRKIENQYPTMSLEEICELPVPTIAAEDTVLFMWVTSPKLAESMQVLEAWGFNYRTCMVWVKDKIGMGYYARQRHELLLIAIKGSPGTPEPSARPDSIIEAPRLEHSAKPEQVYELIERMYPNGKIIELFARNEQPGWASWGNQI